MVERSDPGRELETPRPDASKVSKFQMVMRALRYRNFRLFFIGQLISLIGTWMQMIAQPWLVYRLTGSSLLLGTVGFASQIPVSLLAPLGGTVADRYNRHRVVIATQAASMVLAFILAFLTLTGAIRVWHIVVLSALLGVVNAFDMPGRQAFIVELVDKEDMMNAIALNSSIFNGARVLGPAVAGILIAGIGEGWCFFANGVSFIAVIIGLLMMKLKPPAAAQRRSSGIRDILEGFQYVRRTRPVRAVLLLLGVISLAGMPYTVLMPVFADNILHGGARGMGILMGATGLGALAGAMFLAAQSGTQRLGKLVAYTCAGFGFSLILFAYSTNFWLSALFLFPVGFSFMTQMAATNTLIQTMVPDHLRGRVMAVHVMTFMGMGPFGSFVAGAVAHNVGAPLTVAVGAAICIVGAVLYLARLSSLEMAPRHLPVRAD